MDFPQWFEKYCYTLQKRTLQPAMVCDVLDACAQLQLRPDDFVLADMLGHLYRLGLRHAPATKVANLIAALEQFNYHPGEAWLYHYSQVLATSARLHRSCLHQQHRAEKLRSLLNCKLAYAVGNHLLLCHMLDALHECPYPAAAPLVLVSWL